MKGVRHEGRPGKKKKRVASSALLCCGGGSSVEGAGRIAGLLLALVVAVPAWCAQKQQTGPNDAVETVGTQTPRPLVTAGDKNNMQELKPLEDSINVGHYEQAVPGLKRYLEEHPRSSEGHYDLGYVYFRTHDIEGAIRELSKSLQLNAKKAQPHKILGLVCTFVGRYDLAETELRAAAELDPNSAEIHYWLGRIYYTRQVFSLAEKEFETAIRLNPNYMKAYNNLGLVMEVLGQNEEAVKDYETAARMNEEQHLNWPWPYERLSAYSNRQQQPDRAIEFAQRAIQIDPKCDTAYFDLAKAYQIQKNWKKVVEETQKAIAIYSSTPEYFYLLSIALRKLGKIPESEAAVKQFEQIHEDRDTTAKFWREANESGESGQSKTSSIPAHEPH